MPNREIICADSLPWLQANRGHGAAIITSPPDADEVGLEADEWAAWFCKALHACNGFARGDMPLVFYVTDRKAGGYVLSKAHLIMQEIGHPTWHKIALRRGPDKVDLHRPTYSHLIAFGGKAGPATPDVFGRGKVLYRNAMGVNAARVAVEWARRYADLILDPFCGVGTVNAVADAYGIRNIGIDNDPAQCAKARATRLTRAEIGMETEEACGN